MSEVNEQKKYKTEDVYEDDAEIKRTVQSVKDKSSTRNILIMASSSYVKTPFEINEYHYQELVGLYFAPLEPVAKVLAHNLAKLEERITDIIIFDTELTCTDSTDKKFLPELIANEDDDGNKYSATDFLLHRLNYLDINKNHIKTINFQNNNKQNIERAISEFVDYFNKSFISSEDKIKVHLDVHGGLRKHQIILDAIVSIMKTNSIQNTDIFYAEYNGKENLCIVSNINDIFNIYDFVSGVNEFLNFGRSKSLVTFDKKSDFANDDFITIITNISDSIQLCQMDNFMHQLSKLGEYKNPEHNNYIAIFINMLKESYDVKLFGKTHNLIDLAKDAIENDCLDFKTFSAMLMWCLDKDFIQQALTLIESKTANVLQNEGVFVSRSNELIDVYDEIRSGLTINREEYIESFRNSITSRELWCYGINSEFNSILNNKILNQPGSFESRYRYYTNRGKPFEDIEIDKDLSTIEYFVKNETNNDSFLQEIIEKIRQMRNRRCDNSNLRTYKFDYKIIYRTRHIQLTYNSMNLCLNDELMDNTILEETVYPFFYICKNLKLLRNDANHALGGSTVSMDTLESWIMIFLLMMNKIKSIS